jgi:mannosyl-oligosaccharide alpha-1,2-mannosidase
MIMGLDDIFQEAGSWVEKSLSARLNEKGQVNLFETTIRILGGLLSAYHLSGGENEMVREWGSRSVLHGPKPTVYLERAKDLADRLMSAFTSSPTAIPFSDVVLRERSAHPAPDGLSSTSEVTSVQLEFWYLSKISGDPKYGKAAMKVLEHFKTLPKVEGLVPIYIRLVFSLASQMFVSFGNLIVKHAVSMVHASLQVTCLIPFYFLWW